MQYQQFTPEMRKTHTILVPNMLPIHFRLLISIFGQFGYHMELLESSSRTVVEEGLKNVHNDTCYPALLVVGQFMEALKSGKYDPDKTALLITQTGRRLPSIQLHPPAPKMRGTAVSASSGHLSELCRT